MDRRLPLYLVVDTSGSMSGQAITAVETGIDMLVSTLRGNPHALETVHVSVIAFNDQAEQVVPLTDLVSFIKPDLVAGGTTALGEALSLTADCISREIRRNSPTEKGDWKPNVWIFTDGMATDDLSVGMEKFVQVSTGTVVACAAGPAASVEGLSSLNEKIVTVNLASTNSGDIQSFFKWISDSTATQSKRIDEGLNGEVPGADLAPKPPAVLDGQE